MFENFSGKSILIRKINWLYNYKINVLPDGQKTIVSARKSGRKAMKSNAREFHDVETLLHADMQTRIPLHRNSAHRPTLSFLGKRTQRTSSHR